MKVALSVDIEEDGLFRGRYPREADGLDNLAGLTRLNELRRDFGLVPTLLCTHAVVTDARAAGIVAAWRDVCGAELGVHLHPWGTPPFDERPGREPVHPEQLPEPLLRAKLETLVEAHTRRFGAAPRCFRMGRFEIGPRALALLPGVGIEVDASVVPLRVVPGRVDHFLASAQPSVWPARSGSPGLREIPLTQEALALALPRLLWRVSRRWPRPAREHCLAAFRYVGVVGLAPAWFSLAAMKHAARLHERRGGRLLHVFLHSSELSPGATPAAPTVAHVERLVTRLRSFLSWLAARHTIEGARLSALDLSALVH